MRTSNKSDFDKKSAFAALSALGIFALGAIAVKGQAASQAKEQNFILKNELGMTEDLTSDDDTPMASPILLPNEEVSTPSVAPSQTNLSLLLDFNDPKPETTKEPVHPTMDKKRKDIEDFINQFTDNKSTGAVSEYFKAFNDIVALTKDIAVLVPGDKSHDIINNFFDYTNQFVGFLRDIVLIFPADSKEKNLFQYIMSNFENSLYEFVFRYANLAEFVKVESINDIFPDQYLEQVENVIKLTEELLSEMFDLVLTFGSTKDPELNKHVKFLAYGLLLEKDVLSMAEILVKRSRNLYVEQRTSKGANNMTKKKKEILDKFNHAINKVKTITQDIITQLTLPRITIPPQ